MTLQMDADSLPARLNQVLADSHAFMMPTRRVHWNVEDPGGFALHQMTAWMPASTLK